MWNDVYFDGYADVFFQYKFSDDMFYLKCELYRPDLLGASVWVSFADNSLFLGSLKRDKGFLTLDKTYPVSFLESNNIEKDSPFSFIIKSDDGHILESVRKEEKDRALKNADDILESLKEKSGTIDITPFAENIEKRLSRYKKETPFGFREFEWFMIDNITEDFGLSSVSHITQSLSFLKTFSLEEKWFFGKESINTYAICIKDNPNCPPPMENALDCCVTIESESGKFHIVGIGLFEDGQYFLRL